MLRAGRYTAAILMVAVGAGLIVDLATGSSYLRDWLKYWPVVLIMVGAEYLIMNLFTLDGRRKVRLDIGALLLSFLISGAVVLLVQGKSALADWDLDLDLTHEKFEHIMEHVGEGAYRLGTPHVKPVQHAEWGPQLKKIAISNPNGKVTLAAGEVDRIEIETTVYVARGVGKRAESIVERAEVNVETRGDTLRIEAEGERYSILFLHFKPNMDLRITVPADLEANYELELDNGSVEAAGLQALNTFKAETKNGGIEIAGLAGNAELSTRNGPIRASGIDGNLKARTSNGRIELSGISGNADAETKNGTVIARGIDGSLKGETSNGEIELAQVKGPVDVVTKNGNIVMEDVSGRMSARTNNGNVEAVSGVVGGDWQVKTARGRITLRLPENGDFRIDARTDGEVHTDLDLKVRNRRATGTVGNGTHSIELESEGKLEIYAWN
jgi:DUF4097 and DUF4098 domain-containing protein YvlB